MTTIRNDTKVTDPVHFLPPPTATPPFPVFPTARQHRTIDSGLPHLTNFTSNVVAKWRHASPRVDAPPRGAIPTIVDNKSIDCTWPNVECPTKPAAQGHHPDNVYADLFVSVLIGMLIILVWFVIEMTRYLHSVRLNTVVHVAG